MKLYRIVKRNVKNPKPEKKKKSKRRKTETLFLFCFCGGVGGTGGGRTVNYAVVNAPFIFRISVFLSHILYSS